MEKAATSSRVALTGFPHPRRRGAERSGLGAAALWQTRGRTAEEVRNPRPALHHCALHPRQPARNGFAGGDEDRGLHNPHRNMNNAAGGGERHRTGKRGVLVGLGTDAMTTNMLEELRVALWGQHLRAENPSVGFGEVTERDCSRTTPGLRAHLRSALRRDLRSVAGDIRFLITTADAAGEWKCVWPSRVTEFSQTGGGHNPSLASQRVDGEPEACR